MFEYTPKERTPEENELHQENQFLKEEIGRKEETISNLVTEVFQLNEDNKGWQFITKETVFPARFDVWVGGKRVVDCYFQYGSIFVDIGYPVTTAMIKGATHWMSICDGPS